MDWCRVVGPRGLCGRRAGQGRAGQGRAGQARPGQARAGQGRAGQARPGQGRAGQGRAGQCRAGQGRKRQGPEGPGPLDPRPGTPRPPPKKSTDDVNGGGFGSFFRSHSRGGVTAVLVFREALPSLTVLSRRSAGGLGRSLERPCKWSAAPSAV